MKVQLTSFPFSVFAESKISNKGNKYTSISIRHRQKDKDGNKKDTYYNLIDKKDLLVLSTLLTRAYNAIGDQERKEQISEYEKRQAEQEPPDPCPESEGWQKVEENPTSTEQPFDDDIPF